MIKNIITGVVIGLATLWLWDKVQGSKSADDLGGGSFLARVTRVWSSTFGVDGSLPTNLSTSAATAGSSGGCGCN
jgi:hypothetical protein